MKIFGLIGYPLGHSWSPAYFNAKFKEAGIAAEYMCFELPEIGAFPNLIENTPLLAGLNVTIPYKEAIIPYLDELSPTAKAIGAVNTIAFKDGKLIGHNTDAFGFSETLKKCTLKKDVKALILGTGGAAKAVAYVLGQNGIQHTFVSQTNAGVIQYHQLTAATIAEYQLIINCTPVGMAPKTDAMPEIPISDISSTHVVIDLIYNPPQTILLKKAAAQGAQTMNGQYMLEQQAEKAWQIWLP